MKNEYEVRDDVIAIFIYYKGERIETIISKDDLAKVNEFPNTWYADFHTRRKVFVVRGNAPKINGKRERFLLHRWIVNPTESLVVDHINHNTLDNRSENLRAVTNIENGRNRKGSNKNNKSGQSGVFHKGNGWEAFVTINKKRVYLGYYSKFETAKKVAVEARKRLLNFDKECI